MNCSAWENEEVWEMVGREGGERGKVKKVHVYVSGLNGAWGGGK